MKLPTKQIYFVTQIWNKLTFCRNSVWIYVHKEYICISFWYTFYIRLFLAIKFYSHIKGFECIYTYSYIVKLVDLLFVQRFSSNLFRTENFGRKQVGRKLSARYSCIVKLYSETYYSLTVDLFWRTILIRSQYNEHFVATSSFIHINISYIYTCIIKQG